MADTDGTGRRERNTTAETARHGHTAVTAGGGHPTNQTNGFWRDADWLLCRDGKWRPVESGTFPLVAGLAKGVVPSSYIGLEIDANQTSEARTMRLKGYGNSINAEVAIEFIKSYRECRA
jgi:DNA (cytosine-5)-methyltransferase 1